MRASSGWGSSPAICRQRAMSATKLPRLRRACGVSSSLSSRVRGGEQQRLLGRAGVAVDGRDRLVAEAALGGVDDALERQIVGRLDDQAEVGDRVADFGALVEAEAADDLIRQADGDEALLELAGLELGADEDRDVIEAGAAIAWRFGFLADPPRLLGPVPHADDADLLALAGVGPQRLAEPAGIVRDEAVGGGEDVAGRAVILFEADDRRAGKVLLETQDVGDLGAAPGIDRLVVVADAAEIPARLGEQLQPFVLALVGVLIFVDEDIAEAVAVARRARRGRRGRSAACGAASRRNRRRSASSAAPDIAHRARRRGRRRRLRIRRRRSARESSRGSSSGR